MKKILYIFCFCSIALFANTQIKSIDIFNNVDFINQKLDTKKKSVDLLGVVNLENIKFILPNSCKLNSYNTEVKSYKDDDLSQKIDLLTQKINSNENKIKALNSSIKFLENSSKGLNGDLNILKQNFFFIQEQIEKNNNSIYQIGIDIKSQKESLNKLIKKRTNEEFTRVNYDTDCKNEVLINYPIITLQKKVLFDINYNSKSKKLSFDNTLFLKQSFGKDLKGVDINFYTYSYSDRIDPKPFIPEYLESKKNIRANTEMSTDVALPIKGIKLKKQTSYYIEGTTRTYFQVKGVDLISGEKSKINLSNDIYDGTNSIEIDGYSMSQAYYRVDFKTEKIYGVLNANLYLDSLFIGKKIVHNIKKDEQSSIYFGNSKFIDIKKELIKDLKEEPFFSINREKTQKIWEYTITNRGKKTEKITLLERVPISKDEDIKVKLIGETTETKLDSSGKIYFDFELKPNETKRVNFGYEIDRPDK